MKVFGLIFTSKLCSFSYHFWENYLRKFYLTGSFIESSLFLRKLLLEFWGNPKMLRWKKFEWLGSYGALHHWPAICQCFSPTIYTLARAGAWQWAMWLQCGALMVHFAFSLVGALSYCDLAVMCRWHGCRVVYVWWVSHTGSSRSPMVNQPVRIGMIEAVYRDRGLLSWSNGPW